MRRFQEAVRKAKEIEELRKKEIWFNICKSMPARRDFEDNYQFTPNDYYNKRAFQSNEEINH